MSRSSRVLNAAWVVVLTLYLLDVGGLILTALHSPVPMVVVVGVAPVPFVIAALWLRPESRERLVLLAAPLAIMALGGLSLAWSPDPEYGTRKLSLWLVTGLLPCVSMLVLVSPDRPIAWRVVSIIAFIYAVAALTVGTTTLFPGRLVIFDANPIWVARAAFVGALATLFGPIPNRWKLLLLPPMLLAGHLTDSLGPTLGLFVGIVIGVAETIRTSAFTRRRARLGLAALAVVVAVAGMAGLAVAVSAPPAALAPIVGDPNVSSRAQYLGLAGGMFAASPVIGAGLGAFAALGAADPYPHNIVAEFGSELGIIGLALLVGWLILAVRGALGSPLLLALVGATAVFALFSGSLAGNLEFWMFSAAAVAMTPLRVRAPEHVLLPVT